jgi:hypothetical protein
LKPEDVVREFFDCYTNGRPEDFDRVVAPIMSTAAARHSGVDLTERATPTTPSRLPGAVIRYTADGLPSRATWWRSTDRYSAERTAGRGMSLLTRRSAHQPGTSFTRTCPQVLRTR